MSALDLYKLLSSLVSQPLLWVSLVVVMSFIEITPIKISPFTSIGKWLSKLLTSNIKEDLDEMKNHIDYIELTLDSHIEESIQADVRNRRNLILRSGDEITEGRQYSKERLIYLVSECDKYEEYCIENSLKNGVADEEIKIIKNAYHKIRQEENKDGIED